jgi:hypothetical protein
MNLIDAARRPSMAGRAHKYRKPGAPRTEFTPSGSVTAESRRESEKAGHTMAGGSFPINNAADLARAKHDIGRAHNPAAARAWINRRAKELDARPIGGKDRPADRRYGK